MTLQLCKSMGAMFRRCFSVSWLPSVPKAQQRSMLQNDECDTHREQEAEHGLYKPVCYYHEHEHLVLVRVYCLLFLILAVSRTINRVNLRSIIRKPQVTKPKPQTLSFNFNPHIPKLMLTQPSGSSQPQPPNNTKPQAFGYCPPLAPRKSWLR